MTSHVVQAVCSAFRNQLTRHERRVIAAARRSDTVRRTMRALARAAGVRDPEIEWQVLQDPTWRNQLGWLLIEGRDIEIVIETTPADHTARIAPSLRHRLA